MNENEHVPMELWGKDHWSTLAYIETRLVDNGGFKVEFDPRMWQKRRNFRVLIESALSNVVRSGVPMDPNHGSCLVDGAVLKSHDDWDCVMDMAEAGLLTVEEFKPGEPVTLTNEGQRVVMALRQHKVNGGSFGTFAMPVEG